VRVAFLHAESPYSPEEVEIQRALTKRMIASVRKHMKCEIVHLADDATPEIGADAVVRRSPKGMFWAPFTVAVIRDQPPDTLYLDTDVVIQEDLSWVFDGEFDVALTLRRRRFATYTDDKGVKHAMPMTGGVVFHRNPAFWHDVMGCVMQMTDPMMLAWWGGQVAMYELAMSGKYKVTLLDAERYNYTPNSEDEDVSGKAVVHYKGAHRKHWNLDTGIRLPEKREVALQAQ